MKRAPFPIWATLTPVLGALALWLITQSPFSLMFAALGPLGVVAQRLDRRRSERASRASELGDAELRASLEQEEAERIRERAREEAWSEVFAVPRILAGEAPHAQHRITRIVLGATPAGPMTCASDARIGVVGPEALRVAFARSVTVQQVYGATRGSVSCAERVSELGSCDAVVTLGPASCATLSVGPERPRPFVPHYLAEETARRWLEAHQPRGAEAAGGGLAVDLGLGAAGLPHAIDLASAPHALVGGATGSGKTEFLRAWIVAMATRLTPKELQVVVFDFKGGTGFRDVAQLPHVADVVTDLSRHQLDRVFRALQSEIVRRERALLELNVSDVATAPHGALPRLVVLIDEYQVLVQQSELANSVCADIAARGRALGIHLILATQHPSRSVRETITANCGLRLCLRVLDASESQAILGSPVASTLQVPGEIVSRDERGISQWRVTPTTPVQIAELCQTHVHSDAATAPWLPPLDSPERVRQVAAKFGPGAVAIVDDVERRRYRAVDVAGRGPLAVVGGPGFGKTGMLRRIAEAAVHRGEGVSWLSSDNLAAAWAGVRQAVDSPCSWLLIDDLDDIVAGLDPEYRQGFLDRVRSVSRRQGLQLVVSARRRASLDGMCADAFELVAPGMFRISDAHCFVVPSEWRAPTSAPAPVWVPRGLSCVITDRGPEFVRMAEASGWAVNPVPRFADEFLELRNAPRDGIRLIVGSIEHWLNHRSALTSLEDEDDVLIADGHLSDVRAIRRQRELPPVLQAGEAWTIGSSGVPERVSLDILGRTVH
ncbi:MAG TPA: FtsK/SpoIIIE domain-containing protein [Microbacteriaceae bacterium]|nr:FtsK/SpoIIIE domain-containing protein [Microbacteriaceae bacterium]